MAQISKKNEPPKRIIRPLIPPNFKAAEYVRTEWVSCPEAGTQVEDVLKRDYWQHIAGKVTPGDKIEIVPEDTKWYAEVFVVSKGPISVDVKMLTHVDLSGVEVQKAKADGLSVKWHGTIRKYCVFEEGRSEPVAEGFATEDEAQVALLQHSKNVLKAA